MECAIARTENIKEQIKKGGDEVSRWRWDCHVQVVYDCRSICDPVVCGRCGYQSKLLQIHNARYEAHYSFLAGHKHTVGVCLVAIKDEAGSHAIQVDCVHKNVEF